ncbi:Hypothetical predicted protein [Mytilus galloprovincialis]|uniref:OTU domain-containing protein n=1 Tax=Mytilus galloprovincialis TaxID=29158 RepID=A0A8B6DE16_MYTGA|nr:Hypothetical predicted protein [Mytilus galloprovincialis]
MAGSSQNQWFEVTGVRICIENCTDNNELFESYNQASTSNSQLSENQEKENKNSHEIIKTQENLTMHDHISPEILKSNICSNESIVIENNNEVHIDEGITDIESDVEILSTINNFYDFKPLNTDSKRKLCIIAKIPTKKISKKITPNIHNMGPPSATKTITGDGNCLFRAISYALSNRQEYFRNVRRAIVDHLMTNTEIFRSFLQPRFITVEQHIQTLNMEENNVWGTELEILACADLLKTDIYTFYNAEKEKIKYWTDDTFRARKTNTLKRKYWENEGIRSKKLCLGIKKYKENETYRENLIQAGIQKYQDDEDYRNALIESGIYKYQEDKGYKDALIQSGIEKYKEDKGYRDALIQSGIEKYLEDPEYREKLKQASSKVQICKKEYYDNSIFDLVTTEKYKHKCTDDCKTNCAFEGTCRTSLWICYTCHRKMLKGKIPADSFSNSLLLENVPVELKQLNSIEQQLIAQNIPFMKIMALPKGGQKGVHGPVVCVPSDLKKVTSILPRSEDESLLLKVKLKRKLSYKGYDKYQFVRPNHLEQALLYLKDQNIWYKDVAINNEWINPIPELNDDQVVK